jgi:geranylgeranyl diphosphate synthase type I
MIKPLQKFSQTWTLGRVADVTVTDSPVEHVVLLDAVGRPCGVLPKANAHSRDTPLHLAFSCHVVRSDGAVLLSRRASTKRTWPGTWSNACCGHPQSGESLRDAVNRRLQQELGLRAIRLEVAVPDFAYRAEMADGTIEHELCPVVVAHVEGAPAPDPSEVDEIEWMEWAELCRRVERRPSSLSPWSVLQVAELVATGWSPAPWLGASRLCTDRDPMLEGDPPHAPAGAARSIVRDVVAAPVAAVLREHLARNGDALRCIDARLTDVAAAIDGLVGAGGKRLRPAFVYWGFRATGAPHDDAVWAAAAAVELLHTFALLHDDVMDRSEQRRGMPSAHRAFADLHRAAGRGGDSDWFGISAAVLAGDLAFVCADELLDGMDVGEAAARRVRRVFTELRREVMAGQYLDLQISADPAADEHTARRVALLKSARYTVTRPLQLGSALAPPDLAAPVERPLQQFGDALGLAFQLRDDLLGLYGDPRITGKSALDDLRGGKRTLPVLRAMRLADAAQRAMLERSLGDPTLDEDGAAAVRDIVRATGALASVEVLIAAEHARAVRALAMVPEPARSALADLAEGAVRRAS